MAVMYVYITFAFGCVLLSVKKIQNPCLVVEEKYWVLIRIVVPLGYNAGIRPLKRAFR